MIQESTDIKPEWDYVDKQYRWFTYSADDTGLRLICLEDRDTGAMLSTSVANPLKRTAAHRAWSSARQSRANGMSWEIMHEMGEKGIDPDVKLDEMFRNYGHASVGDMARITVDMGNIPMHLCVALFNTGVINSGQEKSTRYQPKFGKALLQPLKNYIPPHVPTEEVDHFEIGYKELGDLSLSLFTKHRKSLTSAFTSYYKPDTNNPDHKGALGSRVLDCARYFLLFGQCSGLSYETSARDWSRIISELKSSPIAYYHLVAQQLEMLLAPSQEIESIINYKAEAPSLIRHTISQTTTNTNLSALKTYLENKTNLLKIVPIHYIFRGMVIQNVNMLNSALTVGDRIIAQYMQQLYPSLDTQLLLIWVHAAEAKIKFAISKIIFDNHSNYCEMPLLANVTNLSFVLKSSLGETRDFNRHRSWGRFIPLPLLYGEPITKNTIEQILSNGFVLPAYLTEVKQFEKHREIFEKDLHTYYKKLRAFIQTIEKKYGETIDYSFALNLIPLAHQIDIWMHGNPKQALYLTNQRVRPGGHINYRILAYEANQAISNYDQYFESMRLINKPDPSNREQFFDRG